MKLILETHNLSLTDSIKAHVESRVEKLGHLDPSAIDVRVILEHDTTNASEKKFKCSMRVSVPGPDHFGEDSEVDLYAAIDLVTKKLEQQIRKRHNKVKARYHSDAARSKKERQEAEL